MPATSESVSNAAKRVVITGTGLVSPLGNLPETLIAALRAGQSGIRPLTRLPHDALPVNHGAEAIDFSGQINDYGPLPKPLQRTIRKSSKVMCREIEMGVAAAQLALHSAGFDAGAFDRDRTGVVYGCDYIMSLPEEYADGIAACTDEGRFDFGRWGESGLPNVNPLWLLKYLPNMPASHIAIFNDLRGPNNSITVREASAGAAIAEAYSTIQRGHADAILTGATGSRIHALRTLHASMQETLAADRDDADTMSRPFDVSRDGSVVGEGAGAMMLESYEHASGRGATILGEVFGAATSMAGPAAGEQPFRIAMTNVIQAARRGNPGVAIGHVNAHGLSDPDVDHQEAMAIQDQFGGADESPPVTTIKGHIGNLGAGGGMVEAIVSLNCLGETLPPIRNFHQGDEGVSLNLVISDDVPAGDDFISLNVTPQGQSSAVWIGRPR
ncbi:MAG: beta-ketoacyl synthase N-terminal-like domain-containing protein [Planctomycetota bacterium]